jgi:isoleucyl-tRNA synthetase
MSEQRKSLPEIEEALLAFWEAQQTFFESVTRNAPNGEFVFYEGPPTANAPPALHHVESRAYKDVIPRYKTMRGFRVRRKAGWDTHGLPVELQIEKKLGLKTKKDVEDYGIAAFNTACRDSVWAFKEEWDQLTRRIGFWLDLDDPYITYDRSYIESVWWFLKQCRERKLLSRSFKSMWYCPRCETPLSSHEVAQGYADVEDPSIMVAFKVVGIPQDDIFFLAWTTTPWTLPGNLALAVHPDEDYALVRSGDRRYIVAAQLAKTVFGEEADIEKTKPGRELVGYQYTPLYPKTDPEQDMSQAAYTVLPADFVTLEDGTGVVHIAPAYGAEDFELGRAHGVQPILTVDASGKMHEGFPGAGKFFKTADRDVRSDLQARGLLVRDERITHTYPHCWRCSTPLMTYARESWYIEMSRLRPEIQKLNEMVTWRPKHIQQGRMGEWLRELKDWAITRERYWGAPLPIWNCDTCGVDAVIGSYAELMKCATPRNRFFTMRHGEAKHNVDRVVSSKEETSAQYPLTDRGKKGVREAARNVREAGFTKIIASPLHRMRQTAEIVAEELGIAKEEIVYDHDFRELDISGFDGKLNDEFHASYPTHQERWSNDDGVNENWEMLSQRMVRAMTRIDAAHEGETILVCSHGDPLWLLRWSLSGRKRSGLEHVPYPDYDGPTELPFLGALTNDRGEFDVHRPFIDSVMWPCSEHACNGTMRRYPEVADVWLESGAMPFAQDHFPFEMEGREHELVYPADYISEAIDQTRGWFYTMLAVATALGKEQPPFRNCVVLGHLVDAKGKKMSKSKGNIIAPAALIDVYGADVLRWYMLSINQPWDPKTFDEADLKRMSRKPFGTVMNVLAFWELHGGGAVAGWEKSEEHPIDDWLRAEAHDVYERVTTHLDAFEITEAARAVGDFIDSVSTWWLRRSRERLKAHDSGAQQIFSASLEVIATLLAPFAPFTAEHIWQQVRGVAEGDAPKSIHLEMWNDQLPPPGKNDTRLRTDMDTVRQIVKRGLEAREQQGIPVRQPLRALRVRKDSLPTILAELGSETAQASEWLDLITAELNVLTVDVHDDKDVDVELDTVITPELQRAGYARALVRKVNALRKKQGLTPSDVIRVEYTTDDELLLQTIHEHQDMLISSTISASWDAATSGGVPWRIGEASIAVAITKQEAPSS